MDYLTVQLNMMERFVERVSKIDQTQNPDQIIEEFYDMLCSTCDIHCGLLAQSETDNGLSIQDKISVLKYARRVVNSKYKALYNLRQQTSTN